MRRSSSTVPTFDFAETGLDGEQRWHAIGVVEKAVLLIVRVYPEENEIGEEIIRIISARQANQRERRIYIQQAGG